MLRLTYQNDSEEAVRRLGYSSVEAFIRDKASLDWTNRQIGDVIGKTKDGTKNIRKRLGIPQLPHGFWKANMRSSEERRNERLK